MWPFFIEFISTMKEPNRECMWCIHWTVHSSFYSFWVCSHVYLSKYDIFNDDEILFVWYAFSKSLINYRKTQHQIFSIIILHRQGHLFTLPHFYQRRDEPRNEPIASFHFSDPAAPSTPKSAPCRFPPDSSSIGFVSLTKHCGSLRRVSPLFREIKYGYVKSAPYPVTLRSSSGCDPFGTSFSESVIRPQKYVCQLWELDRKGVDGVVFRREKLCTFRDTCRIRRQM